MSLSITKSGILLMNTSNEVNPNLITVDKSFEKTGWVINLFTKTWMNENLTVGKTYTLHYFVTCTDIPTVAKTYANSCASKFWLEPIYYLQWNIDY